MNNDDYRSAMEKLSPHAGWEEKTLQAMRDAQAEEKETKTVRFPKKTVRRAALSAAAVLMLVLVPVISTVVKDETKIAPALYAQPNQAQASAPAPGNGRPQEKQMTGGTAFYAARSMPPEMAENPTQNLMQEEMPQELAVFVLTDSEEEMNTALSNTAQSLGESMTDFSYDDNEKSATAQAGDFRLTMQEQKIRVESVQGVLAQADSQMMPEEKIQYYYELFGNKMGSIGMPAMQMQQETETEYTVALFEKQAEDTARALENYTFNRVELTISADSEALTAVDYTLKPKETERKPIIGIQQAAENGKAEDACAYEICYRRKESELRPYYRFIFSSGNEIYVSAFAEENAEKES